jgi:hypothetical protein
MCEAKAAVSHAVARRGAKTSRIFTPPRAVSEVLLLMLGSHRTWSSKTSPCAAVLLGSPIGRSWDFSTQRSEGNSR